jgi:hypothetical protein
MHIPTTVATAVAAHAAFLATMTAEAAQAFLEVEIEGFWCRFTADQPKGGGALIVRCVSCEAFTNQITAGDPHAGVDLKREGKHELNPVDQMVDRANAHAAVPQNTNPNP